MVQRKEAIQWKAFLMAKVKEWPDWFKLIEKATLATCYSWRIERVLSLDAAHVKADGLQQEAATPTATPDSRDSETEVAAGRKLNDVSWSEDSWLECEKS